MSECEECKKWKYLFAQAQQALEAYRKYAVQMRNGIVDTYCDAVGLEKQEAEGFYNAFLSALKFAEEQAKELK